MTARKSAPRTKAQVRAACKELGYIPNIAARSLVSRRTRTIGLLVPDISNDYFAGAALAIEEAARENGYRVLLCNSLRDSAREAEAVDALLRRQVEGLIVAPVSAASADSLQDSCTACLTFIWAITMAMTAVMWSSTTSAAHTRRRGTSCAWATAIFYIWAGGKAR